MNKPKSIGTRGESAVVAVARTRGFPGADRLTLTGALDRGDVGLAPGVICEVKSGHAAEQASDAQIVAWLQETERERTNAGADHALLVTKRKGIGHARAGQWWTHLTIAQFLQLLGVYGADLPNPGAPLRMTLDSALALVVAAGYGTEQEAA